LKASPILRKKETSRYRRLLKQQTVRIRKEIPLDIKLKQSIHRTEKEYSKVQKRSDTEANSSE
jgi:hypothetical protein